MEVKTTYNCGTFDLDGVSDFRVRTAKDFFRNLGDECAGFNAFRSWTWPAFFIYSDAAFMRRNAESLTKYIHDHNYGTVTVSPSARNPNTGNDIRIYVWQVNREEMAKIFAEGED